MTCLKGSLNITNPVLTPAAPIPSALLIPAGAHSPHQLLSPSARAILEPPLVYATPYLSANPAHSVPRAWPLLPCALLPPYLKVPSSFDTGFWWFFSQGESDHLTPSHSEWVKVHGDLWSYSVLLSNSSFSSNTLPLVHSIWPTDIFDVLEHTRHTLTSGHWNVLFYCF